MITDNTSSVAPDVVKNLISNLDEFTWRMKRSSCYFKIVERNNNTEDVRLQLQLIYMYLKILLKTS
jgi:penicillin amidase